VVIQKTGPRYTTLEETRRAGEDCFFFFDAALAMQTI
jgi:hypothetical protein